MGEGKVQGAGFLAGSLAEIQSPGFHMCSYGQMQRHTTYMYLALQEPLRLTEIPYINSLEPLQHPILDWTLGLEPVCL